MLAATGAVCELYTVPLGIQENAENDQLPNAHIRTITRKCAPVLLHASGRKMALSKLSSVNVTSEYTAEKAHGNMGVIPY